MPRKLVFVLPNGKSFCSKTSFVNTFYLQDCISGSSLHLPDESIDLVLSDPPYGISGDTLHKHYNRDESNVLEGYVDVSSENYENFSKDWIRQASRVLRPGGRIIVVSGYSNLHSILRALNEPANKLVQISHLIWKYNFGVWTTQKYVSSHYHILYYEKFGGEIGIDRGDDSQLDYGSVWFINREYKTGQVRNKNQLPSILLDRLIQLGCPQYDITKRGRSIVADFFLGSFSTAHAAYRFGHDATGFEINPTAYYHYEPLAKEALLERQDLTLKKSTIKSIVKPALIRNCKILSKWTSENGTVDLIISWPSSVPNFAWFERVYLSMRKGASFYLVIKSTDLLQSLTKLKQTKLKEINHVIWLTNTGSARYQETHLHILFFYKGGSRTFNTFAFFNQKERLKNGGSANYAHREDVWTNCSEGSSLTWSDIVEKCVRYSSNKGDKIASFCEDDGVISKVVTRLEREYTSGKSEDDKLEFQNVKFNEGGVRGSQPREFDQFFTQPSLARACVANLASLLTVPLTFFDTILEPSFGDGAFLEALYDVSVFQPKLKFVDIDAKEICYRADFLKDNIIDKNSFHTTSPPKKTCLTIGNPPFGKNANLAIAFFNKAALFSDVIAFIVPKTFKKASLVNKLDRNMFLIKEKKVRKDGFIFEGEIYNVPCVFQVWVHANFDKLIHNRDFSQRLRELKPVISETPDFIFVKPLENPDIAIRRNGVNAGRIFDQNVSQKSAGSHSHLRFKNRNTAEISLNRLKSLNMENMECKYYTAGNPSISRTEICELYMSKYKCIS